jgi:hypothetical protein
VWAIILDYAAPGLSPDQLSPSRLLSRSFTAGVDERMRLEAEEGVKRDRCLRLVPVDSDGIVCAPIHSQRLALLALSRAPTEFLQSITKVESEFLRCRATLTASHLQGNLFVGALFSLFSPNCRASPG